MVATGLFTHEDETSRVMDELVSLRYTASQLRFAFVVLLEQDAKPRTLYDKYQAHLMKDFLDRGLSKDSARQELQRTLKASWLAQGNTEDAWFLRRPAPLCNAHGMPVPNFPNQTPATAASEAGRLWNLIKRDPGQSGAARDVIDVWRSGTSRLIFCHGKAGCGKSTLAKYISYYVRSFNKGCVNVASTGIAALDLPDGATAHSTFKIPIEDAEHLTCRLGHSSADALTIAAAAVIQWDEWPSCKRAAWGAVLDYLTALQRAHPDIYFPNVIITYGDFRQILPVLKHASRQDIRAASVTTSPSWPSFRNLATPRHYASWIERIGQGDLPHTHSIDGEPGCVELDRCSVIHTMDNAISYCSPHVNDPAECAHRKILTATNEARNCFNDRILDTLTQTHLLRQFVTRSSDAIEYDSNNDAVEDHITAEFLHLQGENGVPPHSLRLVVGGLYELMRNFSPCDRLMNHAQVALKAVCEKHVLVERLDGQQFPLPRICFRWALGRGATTIRRRQYPLRPAYASTFNGSQGTALARCVVDVRRSPFSHGHLYVALSRVETRTNIRIFTLPERCSPAGKAYLPLTSAAMPAMLAKPAAAPSALRRPAGNAVLDTSVPTRPQPDAGNRVRASLYTVNINFEMVDAPTEANAGSRVALSDGMSMRSGAPANRHGLATTVKRATDLLKLKVPPNGVCVSAEGLQPPQSGRNPTSGRSWAFVAAAYGDSVKAATLATEHVAARAVDIITHCFLKADLHIPATDTAGAWTAKSTLLNNRVSIRRTGTMTNGQTCELSDLINLVYTIHPNVPTKVARTLKDFFGAYPSIITESAGPALVGPASTTANHGVGAIGAAAPSAPKRGAKRAATPAAKQTARKQRLTNECLGHIQQVMLAAWQAVEGAKNLSQELQLDALDAAAGRAAEKAGHTGPRTDGSARQAPVVQSRGEGRLRRAMWLQIVCLALVVHCGLLRCRAAGSEAVPARCLTTIEHHIKSGYQADVEAQGCLTTIEHHTKDAQASGVLISAPGPRAQLGPTCLPTTEHHMKGSQASGVLVSAPGPGAQVAPKQDLETRAVSQERLRHLSTWLDFDATAVQAQPARSGRRRARARERRGGDGGTRAAEAAEGEDRTGWANESIKANAAHQFFPCQSARRMRSGGAGVLAEAGGGRAMAAMFDAVARGEVPPTPRAPGSRAIALGSALLRWLAAPTLQAHLPCLLDKRGGATGGVPGAGLGPARAGSSSQSAPPFPRCASAQNGRVGWLTPCRCAPVAPVTWLSRFVGQGADTLREVAEMLSHLKEQDQPITMAEAFQKSVDFKALGSRYEANGDGMQKQVILFGHPGALLREFGGANRGQLGPGVNLARLPWNGRLGEYMDIIISLVSRWWTPVKASAGPAKTTEAELHPPGAPLPAVVARVLGKRPSAATVPEKCAGIKMAIAGAEGYSQTALGMLCRNMDTIMGSCKEERSKYQEQFMAMVSAVLDGIEKAKKDSVDAAMEKVTKLASEYCTCKNTLEAASADVAAKKAALEAAKEAVAAAEREQAEADATLRAAQQAAEVADADAAAAKDELQELVDGALVPFKELAEWSNVPPPEPPAAAAEEAAPAE
ncbi:unnamed protein product [Prorocentrum cordatum]|uniref:ATP-dependent DNA helicase n=1 Tax=Prorocentrum cordatum TaxID=2364126 RepID=A0ABN9VER2_9DINO|nr:unnamed protein product [Polarella glacialis]